MPEGMLLQIASYDEFPFYMADEQEKGFPSAVQTLGDAIARADALVIASPEYNFGIPGAFKNALDWLSRLPSQPCRGKPVALLGVSPGPVGTARMQYELRRVLHHFEARVLLRPEVFINHSASRFSLEGHLVDTVACQLLSDQMLALRRLIIRERAAHAAEANLDTEAATLPPPHFQSK